MKKIFSIIYLLPLLFLSAAGQSPLPESYDVYAGMGSPLSPDKFYDYWQYGIVLGCRVSFKQSNVSSIRAFTEYARFGLDKKRFLKGIKLPEEGNSISGATTNIVLLGFDYQYFPIQESSAVRGYFLISGAVGISSIGSFNATYTDYTTKQESILRLAVIGSLGVGYLVTINSNVTWLFETKYSLGLLKNPESNTAYLPITTGLKMQLR